MTQKSPFQGLRVLYLEDEPLIAFDTSEHLKELGFESVVSVYRLDAAEAACQQEKFDLAVFDINVDQSQSSIPLGKQLQQEGVRVLFASGNGCDESMLLAAGHHFIGKPYSLDALTQKMRTMVQSRD